MPAAVRQVTSAPSGTAAAFTCARPPTAVAGDLLVAYQAADIGDLTVMGAPSGGGTWNLLVARQWGSGSGAGVKLWYKTHGASEPTNYSFSQNGQADGLAIVVALSGAATPILYQPLDTYTPNVFPTSHNTPGITPGGPDDVELRFIGSPSGSATTWGAPAGFTPGTSVQSQIYTTASLAHRVLSSSAPTGTAAFTSSPGLSLTMGFTLAIPSAGPALVTKSGSDTAVAADLATPSVTLIRPDSATLTEEAAAGPAAADAATAAEDAAVAAGPGTGDAAALAEQASTVSSPARVETGALADVSALVVSLFRDDSAFLVEQANVGLAALDAATLAETAAREETIGPSTGDAAGTAETAAVAGAAGAADEAALTESARVDVLKQSSDSAALAEHADAGPVAADAVALTESASVLVVIDASDSVTAADAGAALRPVAAMDSATATDSAAVAEVGRALDSADGPRRLWHASLAPRPWRAEPPRRSWSATHLT
ncbi:hypothetical protein [Nonomuraea wenchangensis]|uniref:Uncharacterized protein n=1 Tax=Nonomuraea wenchangensis TaxID=568860 RepID=A0A1I0LWD2_9ACTN|nr:hypothetical protein [Nonomuraea wenchangensis]SEU46576.1 hypothetical protein SAMN05421811_12783 [Nonomuraea wenchangensis]